MNHIFSIGSDFVNYEILYQLSHTGTNRFSEKKQGITEMDQKDKISSKDWAIAPLAGGGAIASYNAFLLINRTTNREHTLHIPAGGLQVGISAAAGQPSFTIFRTKKKVTFADFDGVGARITTANIGLIFGYSLTYLTLWVDAAYTSRMLMQTKMSGGGIMLPGGGVGHGVSKLSYGNGRPSGAVPMVMEMPEDWGPPAPREAHYQVKPNETAILTLPEDILFEFGKHHLKPQAQRILFEIADMLNNRISLPVKIDGHTDSVGDAPYNKTLSHNRAMSVKNWFAKHKVYKADNFLTVGHGEEKPVKPNLNPDGSDNPKGRSENRRVEIIFRQAYP